MKFSKSTTLLFSAISSAVHDISTAQSVEPSCSGDEALVELSAITKNINNTDLGGDYDPFGLSLALLDTTNGNVTFDCTNCKFIVDGLESSYNDTMTSYEQKNACPRIIVIDSSSEPTKSAGGAKESLTTLKLLP